MEDISIKLSKGKILLILLGSVCFIALGLQFLSLDIETIKAQRKVNSPLIVYTVGLLTAGFSVLTFSAALRKLIDQKPGLVFVNDGILDNSSAVSAGLIRWEEIDSIHQIEVTSQKFLAILVKDPKKYLSRGNLFQRFLNKQNAKLCGTPITISSNTLQIKFEDLINVAQTQLRSRRSGA